MRGVRSILLAIIATTIAGCATGPRTETMNSWMGHQVTELIASWGPPSTTVSDGSGGQILTYNRSNSTVIAGESLGNSSVWGSGWMAPDNVYETAGRVVQAVHQRTFWVDSHGVIYRWSSKG